MPPTTYQLTTVGHAAEIGTKLPRSWFRGHATVCGELTPKIYRADYEHAWKRNQWFECQMIKDFMRLAVPMMADPPEVEQKLRWIFLMQHHGAPTKLLDWTERILVALYFAVQGPTDKDGELWAMRPAALNEKHGLESVPCADDAEARSVLKFFERDPCESLDGEDAKKVEYPFAIKPAMYSQRMMAQFSTFTVHPRRSRTANALPNVLTEPADLVRYIIPGRHKARLRSELESLGITERTLFWDLDALSRSLVREYDSRCGSRDGAPQPPECDGLWENVQSCEQEVVS